MDPVIITAIATVAIALINAAASVLMLLIRARYGFFEAGNGAYRGLAEKPRQPGVSGQGG